MDALAMEGRPEAAAGLGTAPKTPARILRGAG